MLLFHDQAALALKSRLKKILFAFLLIQLALHSQSYILTGNKTYKMVVFCGKEYIEMKFPLNLLHLISDLGRLSKV